MKNSVNQQSVLPVSFECTDGKRFRFHQIGPMTHLKKKKISAVVAPPRKLPSRAACMFFKFCLDGNDVHER